MLVAVVLLAVYAGLASGLEQPRTIVPTLDGRIVGGRNADIVDYPWTISLQYSNSHFCGGVIISSTWVLSAAHCVIGYPLSEFTVRAGATTCNVGGQVITVSAIIAHAEFNADYNSHDYDISAIRLSIPIAVKNAVPIPIAPAGDGPDTAATAVITGWGLTGEVLQVVEVPIVSQVNCRLSYGDRVTDRMFCAGATEGGRDACQGDSGGPLVVGNIVFGLVSWGRGCALSNYPGVYSSLPAFRSWITANTGV